MRFKYFCINLLRSAYYLRSVIKHYRRVDICRNTSNNRIFILANGASLKGDIDEFIPQLAKEDVLMMNNSISDPLHSIIKPRYHILLDSMYFIGDTYNVMSQIQYQKVASELERILSLFDKVDYPLRLLVPSIWQEKLIINNPYIIKQTYGITLFRGFDWMARILFLHALALPSNNNVLVASLICCIAMGYQYIYILGCDHDWIKDYRVNEHNILQVKPTHFYNEEEIAFNLDKTNLSRYLLGDAEIFGAYNIIHTLFRDINIKNLSSNSMIDAFPRDKLQNVLAK